MSLSDVFKFILPRDKKFMPLFRHQVENLKSGARKLIELYDSKEEPVIVAKIDEIKVLEREGDKIYMEIIEALNGTFLTPFDREDIHLLANEIDSVMDFIHKGAKRVSIYSFRDFSTEYREMAVLLENAVLELSTAIELLENLKNSDAIRKSCFNIFEIEENSDEINRKYLRKLFDNEDNAKELFKKKDIFGTIEKAIDHCNDAADSIISIVVKNT